MQESKNGRITGIFLGQKGARKKIIVGIPLKNPSAVQVSTVGKRITLENFTITSGLFNLKCHKYYSNVNEKTKKSYI
jgi:hypothetical protein